MVFNLKKDWEQTKETLERLDTKYKLNAVCQSLNPEMTDVVNAYKQEEMAWYNHLEITENAFQTTTQSLWYTHYLNKRRLKSLGVIAKYEYIHPTDYSAGNDQRLPRWDYNHDGKNLICRLSDSMNYRKSFYSNNRFLWAEDGKGLPGEYYIMQSKNVNGRCICPNCGYEDTLENLVDGCDYCDTKFQIEDFRQKVSSVYLPNNTSQQRDGFAIHKSFLPLYFILVVITMAMIGFASSRGVVGMLLTPVIIIAFIVIFLAIVLGKTSKQSIQEGPGRTKQTLEQLRKVDSHFSEEAFIGNLSNKLMSIHYAESINEIQAFTECDMTQFIHTYKNVLDCKILKCVLMGYHTDGAYQHLDVNVDLGLTIYENNKVLRATTHLGLHLIRSINALTPEANDINIYKCHGCGSSLSLLNGGQCQYCGSGLELKKYDWVITDYTFLNH